MSFDEFQCKTDEDLNNLDKTRLLKLLWIKLHEVAKNSVCSPVWQVHGWKSDPFTVLNTVEHNCVFEKKMRWMKIWARDTQT